MRAALSLAVAVVSLSSGCAAVNEDTFIVEWETEFCALYTACASDEMLRSVGLRECHEFLRSQDYRAGEPPSCGYDGAAAALCLEDLTVAVDEQSCNGVDPLIPATCLAGGASSPVYSDCRLPRLPAAVRGGATVTAE